MKEISGEHIGIEKGYRDGHQAVEELMMIGLLLTQKNETQEIGSQIISLAERFSKDLNLMLSGFSEVMRIINNNNEESNLLVNKVMNEMIKSLKPSSN